MTQSFRLFKELLVRLPKNELTALKKAIQIHSVSAQENKSLKLVKLCLKDPDISEVAIQKQLYGSLNRTAFIKLVERAIEKIDELYIAFTRDVVKEYSERNYYHFQLKRKILILQMRWLRGIDFDLMSQFEKIISISKKYELYDIAIEALNLKQRYVGYRFGRKAFNKLEEDISKYEELRKAQNDARRIFIRFGSRVVESNNSIAYKDELKSDISILSKNFKSTKVPSVGFFFYYLQAEWLHMYEKYSEAERILRKMLKLLIDHPSIYTRTRYADVLSNLATNSMHLKNFDQALAWSALSKEYADKNSQTERFSMEVDFYVRFYNDEFELADRIIKLLFNATDRINTPILFSQRAYLYACLKTMRGKIAESNLLLEQSKESGKNNSGWNIGKRILTIVNQIELNDYESVDSKVLSLEKFIKRISKDQFVRKRDRIILRILLKLINESFNFNKVYKSRRKYFELLESNDKEYGWKIRSPELIKFHEWFKRKMKEQEKGDRKSLTYNFG